MSILPNRCTRGQSFDGSVGETMHFFSLYAVYHRETVISGCLTFFSCSPSFRNEFRVVSPYECVCTTDSNNRVRGSKLFFCATSSALFFLSSIDRAFIAF
ncbi:hypothetical protein CRM22_001457 [Opisthorchis felineus]|uniref:Uncharacterized protein n=1 Tax=Opisthorchis felineus TaxID=147828 RepID=A0A4V6RH74_OPIFE|nr:hypothetical protein CRM22_001457 [Opisthorchis felineus]